VVVFEIDQSEYSPHQVNNRYLMRIDGQTKPAPHHYVESLFKKIRFPNLECHSKVHSVGFENRSIGHQELLVTMKVVFFNFSPLQNEEQLSFQMVSSGEFRGKPMSGFPGLYENLGRTYQSSNVKDVFHFGQPIQEFIRIWFNTSELLKAANVGELVISFGGKMSPVKANHYRFDFNEYYKDSYAPILIKVHENILSKDLQDKLGSSKDSIIKDILK